MKVILVFRTKTVIETRNHQDQKIMTRSINQNSATPPQKIKGTEGLNFNPSVPFFLYLLFGPESSKSLVYQDLKILINPGLGVLQFSARLLA